MYLAANDPLVQSLVKAAESISTVDMHQHLGPEAPVTTDLCRLLVADNYLATDLVSSGLSQPIRERIADLSVDVCARWDLFRPFWERVRYGSYGEAVRITLRDLYGARGLISPDEIREVSTRITEDFARPGLFQRVLAELCNIRVVLTQGGYFHHERPRFYTVARPLDRADFSRDGAFETEAAQLGIPLQTTEDLVSAMDAILKAHGTKGAVGFKIGACPWKEPQPAEVKEAFSRRDEKFDYTRPPGPLICLYISRICKMAEELDVPVAVHTGAPWTNWLDYRIWEPTAIIPLLLSFRDTQFDLYHAGIPYGTQASMLGKAFPNVWLDLTWAHIISSELAMRSIAEWLDLAPINKVLGFGGDYGNGTMVLTYGHLKLARSNLAQVLAFRVKEHRMTKDDACWILAAWLSDNSLKLYKRLHVI